MKIRFLQTTSSAMPGYPFQAGQVVDLQNVPSELPAWIAEGRAEIVQDEPEVAVAVAAERAVMPRGEGSRVTSAYSVPWRYRDDDALLALASGSRQLVTAPATEPVSVDEAKAHLRIAFDDENTLVERLIRSARKRLETWLSRAFLTQTWDYALDWVPCGDAPILLPIAPLQSVTSVTTYDIANVGTVFSSSNYLVDTISEPGRIVLNDGQVWPTSLRIANAVIVRHKVGHIDASSVPEDLTAALLLLVGHLYAHREQVVDEEKFPLPAGVESLAGPYRMVRP